MLWARVVGLVLQRHARWYGVAALIMVAWSMPFLLKSHSHPLLGERSVLIGDRVDQDLRYNPAARARYVGSTDFIRSRGCARIGLVLPSFSLEYPFWALLPEVLPSQPARARGGQQRLSSLGGRWCPLSPARLLPWAGRP